MKLQKFLLPLAFTTLLSPVKADEGMWLLPLLKQQNSEQLKEMGLKIDIDDIYNPDSTSLKDAVVIFGRGCTGEIISPEGLLLTNHHCGYEAIQQHSTVEHDYLTDGFWAMNRKEELATPGLEVRFIDKIEDVTDYVKEKLAQDTIQDVMRAFNSKELKSIAEEKAGKDFLKENSWIEVDIIPFYGGNKYYMFTKKVYKDIRLVGAPPSSIGKYGADTDNWMWPRHTGDFSIFRVYADKDGNPAEYSEENVPLIPKKYFNISTKGIQENDYTMILGFPGSTNRYYTSWDVKQRRDISNATRIHIRGIRQNEMLDEMLNDPQKRIQYASKYAQSSNYWKNSIGMNRGIDKLNVIKEKEAEEKTFKEWAIKNNRPEYTAALDSMQTALQATDSLLFDQNTLNEALIRGVEFSRAPRDVTKLIEALKQKNEDIIHQELEGLRTAYDAFANKDYNTEVDKRISKVMISTYMNDIPAEKRPEIFKTIERKYKGNINKYVDDVFAKSIYGSDDNFEKFIKNPSAKILEKDPMILFAQSVNKKNRELTKEMAPLTQKFTVANQEYIKGLLEMNAGKPSYPDANFTLRMTYGKVLPYNPADGITYHYSTTLEGVMEKEDPNNWEFVVPAKLKELYDQKNFGEYAFENGEMPCNFISNNDITGGNSGSPVINANGEIIGTAFDGNWEAMSGDIAFEKKLQRTINVDIRYILFIIDKFAGAKHLIEEMTIVK